MYHGLFNLFPTAGCLDFIQSFTITDSDAMKNRVCVCKFVHVQVTYTGISVELISKSGISRSRVNAFAVLVNISRRPSIEVVPL